MKSDPERALKWTQRADELTRLAELARVQHVQDLLNEHANWAYDMAAFWDGVWV